ncbi:hypothetical protein NTCA1_00030 [Novosphingobium sp. TCA1]|nr:hypothetical protein NTCA1_00030 [Novosphingobium sp. TCA1]
MREVVSEDAIEKWLEGIESPENDQDEKIVQQEVLAKIRNLLDLDFGKQGVLSLSEKWDEPLLWSHYADQHRGICIEYDAAAANTSGLGKVDYRAPRALRANDLYQWKVNGDAAARKRAYDGYFFAKADDWEYEREWRDIAEQAGLNPSPFKISAIYIGMRCDEVWVNLLKPYLKEKRISLRKIIVNDHTFALASEPLNSDDLELPTVKTPSGKVSGGIYHALPNSETVPNWANLMAIGQIAQKLGPLIGDAVKNYHPTIAELSKLSTQQVGAMPGIDPSVSLALSSKIK